MVDDLCEAQFHEFRIDTCLDCFFYPLDVQQTGKFAASSFLLSIITHMLWNH